jgi:hypothetical protein
MQGKRNQRITYGVPYFMAQQSCGSRSYGQKGLVPCYRSAVRHYQRQLGERSLKKEDNRKFGSHKNQ